MTLALYFWRNDMALKWVVLLILLLPNERYFLIIL